MQGQLEFDTEELEKIMTKSLQNIYENENITASYNFQILIDENGFKHSEFEIDVEENRIVNDNGIKIIKRKIGSYKWKQIKAIIDRLYENEGLETIGYSSFKNKVILYMNKFKKSLIRKRKINY